MDLPNHRSVTSGMAAEEFSFASARLNSRSYDLCKRLTKDFCAFVNSKAWLR
jgi:hypothetical protein